MGIPLDEHGQLPEATQRGIGQVTPFPIHGALPQETQLAHTMILHTLEVLQAAQDCGKPYALESPQTTVTWMAV